jgi:CHASE2 domain-containing sensor protein
LPEDPDPQKREQAANVGVGVSADAAAPPADPTDAEPVADANRPADSADDSDSHDSGARARARREILRDTVKGLVFAGLILLIQIGFEHTRLGHGLEELGYEFLQGRLTFDKVPVYVIDISDLKPTTEIIDGRPYTATSRAELRAIISAVVEQEPRAVGVDIDFSPDDAGFITPGDREFFRFCASQKVPVFLGVHRTLALPTAAWLGDPEFEPLAAGIILPNDSRRVPKWIKTGEHNPPGRTLSGAVAAAFGESRCEGAERLCGAGLAEQVSEREFKSGGGAGEIAVDYSPLEKLSEDRTLRTKNPEVIRDQGRRLRGQIVLIGDAGTPRGRDFCRVPGREQLVPGVYCHAAAAYTLVQAPLYELTTRGRILLDITLSGLIIIALALIRLLSLRGRRGGPAVERVRGWLTLLVILAAFVLGVLFVRRTCVMWSDFLLALGFLALHPSIEHRLEHLLHRLARALKSAWHSISPRTRSEK